MVVLASGFFQNLYFGYQDLAGRVQQVSERDRGLALARPGRAVNTGTWDLSQECVASLWWRNRSGRLEQPFPTDP